MFSCVLKPWKLFIRPVINLGGFFNIKHLCFHFKVHRTHISRGEELNLSSYLRNLALQKMC